MRAMNLGIALAFLAMSTAASAAGAAVNIIAPADGATLDAMAENKINYEVTPGPDGDHIHLYVDGEEAALLRKLKGSYALESLSPGAHRLCIKVVNKNHTPVGAEKCVGVKVQ